MKGLIFQEKSATIQANSVLELPVVGDVMTCVEASADFKLSIRGHNGELLFKQGFSMPVNGGFDGVTLRNDTATDIAVTLLFTTADFRDRRMFVEGGIAVQPASSITEIDDVSALPSASTALIAANAARAAVLVGNTSETITLRVGAAPAANKGMPVAPGQVASIPTTGALAVYNPDAGAIVPVTVSELLQ